ncbi:MAG: hypothetical protein A2086_15290 [Spirochaetes bacterium GWD1_27_9]|nr:MAG: hypothetical protein A2Z98_05900 [Spirochaetes bacterium GWB1_27_13]OHD25184.1 MAG: hypothetical protein A2Y34_14980 [Spirochaetes bacterium GWC1_27_15]OHD31260.1 MAG: hypothetical protein A2086_15290 [Spirochaetes bacterium GWD1_27_9]
MNKYKIKIIFFLILIFLVSTKVFSKDKTDDLIKRIEDLEQQKEYLEKMLDVKVDGINNDFTKKYNDFETSIKKDNTLIIIISLVIAAFIVLSSIGFFIKIDWIGNKIAKKFFEIKLDKYLKNHKNKLIEILETEENLKNKKRILVLSNIEEKYLDTKFIEQMKKNFKFIFFDNINNYEIENIKSKSYNMIIFNNYYSPVEEKNKNEYFNKIDEIMQNHSSLIFLYYGYKYEGKKGNDDNINLNYANSRITLYTRIVQCLKYQEDFMN